MGKGCIDIQAARWAKCLSKIWINICNIRVFYLPTDAQESSFQNIKIYIKTAPTYFGLITITREPIIWDLLKLLLLK
jgi:hypothetical protein